MKSNDRCSELRIKTLISRDSGFMVSVILERNQENSDDDCQV